MRAYRSRGPGSSGSTPTATSNTPDSSVYGYFDGMGTAVLTGNAWPAMRNEVPGSGPIAESQLVLAGARDFDPNEKELLDRSKVVFLRPSACTRRMR